MEFLFFFFVLPIVAAVVGGIVAGNKNRSVFGWLILCLFFPIAVVIILVLKPLPEKNGPTPGNKKVWACPCGHENEGFFVQCQARRPVTRQNLPSVLIVKSK